MGKIIAKNNNMIMMKRLFAILFLAGIVSLISCNKGDKQNSMDSFCYVTVSEDVLKVADVTIHYINENGQEATELMTTTVWKKRWIANTFPATLGVWAQMSPKLVMGEAKDTYQLKVVASTGYLFHSANGKDWGDGWANDDPNAAPDNVAAADVQNWCSKGATVGCEVDAKGMGKPAKVDFGGNDDNPWEEPQYPGFCEWVFSLFGLGPEHCH